MEVILEAFGAGESGVLSGTAFEGIETAFRSFGKQDIGKAYARMPYVITVE